MELLEQLQNNKGTVSSALGKELGKLVLSGNEQLLHQAIELTTFNQKVKSDKNIRAGAAKIVEIVAEKRPELVAPELEKLMPALEVDETQTRWMVIRTIGFCAHINETIASKAVLFAQEYITNKEGLCLSGAADLFLGDYGAVSKKTAKKAFPLIEKSISNVVKNESDWILEALIKMFKNLDTDEQQIAVSFARINLHSEKKATQKRALKIMKLADS